LRQRWRNLGVEGQAELLGLDPAEQVFAADRLRKSRMVSGQVISDEPDHPVAAVASGRLLFTYLVVNRHRRVPRDELAEALWKEPDPAAVDARLNPLLSKLRRVFGADAVEGRSTLRLDLPRAWVDLEAAVDAIHRAESAVAQNDWARAWGPCLVALFVAERDFLIGEDSPWINEIRHQLDVVHIQALECYAAASLGLGGPELAGAVRAGRQLTRLAPLRESGYRYLMRALAAQDNLAEALHVYGQLCERLRDQLGVSPSPATRDLYERFLAAT
jgi:DNA-binding SARP family transcriptional activator